MKTERPGSHFWSGAEHVKDKLSTFIIPDAEELSHRYQRRSD